MTACAYCGRDNDPGAQFCMDCGKPVVTMAGSAASPAPGASPRPAVAARRSAADPCPFCDDSYQNYHVVALESARRGLALDPALPSGQQLVRRAGRL
jgi:hypothetical protein